MAVNCAVAAEDERCVRLVGWIELVAGKQVYARQLESPNVVFLGDRSEKGDSAHGATFAQAVRNSNPREKPRELSASSCTRLFQPPIRFNSLRRKQNCDIVSESSYHLAVVGEELGRRATFRRDLL